MNELEIIDAMTTAVWESKREDGWSPMVKMALTLNGLGYDKNIYGKMEARFLKYPKSFKIYEVSKTEKYVSLVDAPYDVAETPEEYYMGSVYPEEMMITGVSELSGMQFERLRPYIADSDLASSKELLTRVVCKYFFRLKSEGKLLRNGRHVIWNTGISSHSGCKMIGYGNVEKKGIVRIIMFAESDSTTVSKWISNFGAIPKTAEFPSISEPFNPNYEIRVNRHHILVERFWRFPKGYKNFFGIECESHDWKEKVSDIQEFLKLNTMVFEGSIAKTLRLIRETPIIPVNFWNIKTNSLDWLIPIDLGVKIQSFVALLLRLQEEDGQKYYNAYTILDTNAAYSNARLLGPVLSNWLKWESRKEKKRG